MQKILQKHRHLLPLTPFLFFLTLSLLLHFLHATLVYAGSLTSTDVQPASLLAGATSTVTISFTTSASGSIPNNGKVQVVFPATFDLSGASGGTCSTMDGGFSTSVSSSTLTITRDGTGTATATSHAESCTVNNVKNPTLAQASSTYSLATRNSANTIIDSNNAVTADTFTPNVLSSTNVEPASLLAGATSTVTVTFTTSNIVGASDKVVVVFPSGYTLSGVSGVACSSMDGSFSVAVISQTVRIIRSGGSIYNAGTAHTCTISNVVNPTSVTTTGTYSISTTSSGDVTRDQDTAVAGDTTTPNVLSSTSVVPGSLLAGATSTVTATFTTVNSISSTDNILVVFPSGYNVASASGGTCSGMDGSFLTSVSGQTVTLTRSGGSTQSAGAKSCTIATIINPTSAGSTGTYSIQTTTSASAVRDQDTAVAASTIVANSLSSTGVTPASLIAAATSTVTATFTTTNSLLSTDKIKITFPSGFNVASAASGACTVASVSIGSITTSVSGQVVTLTRTSGSTVNGSSAVSCTVDSIVNPTSAGATGTYTIQTTASDGSVRDQNTSVTGSTITAGSLGGVSNVQPASLTAGATSTVTVSFTTASDLLNTDKIKVTFPSGFNVASAASGACTVASVSIGSITTSVSGQVVTLTRTSGSTVNTSTDVSCTIASIVNPTSAGSTGTYAIQITASDDSPKEQDAAVAADTITANALSSTDVQPGSLLAGATPTVTLNFTTVNSLLNTDKVKITFPSGFNVASASSGACTVASVSIGSITTAVSGQVVTLTRTSGSTVTGATAVSCTVGSIVNPTSAGSTGTYTLQTTASDDSVRDQDSAVVADTITANVLSSTSVVPGSLLAGATSTVTATFTTTNSLLNTDKVKITFPSGFDVASAASGACTVASVSIGSITTSVSGQVVTLTRTSGSTVNGSSAVSCTVGSIVNPTSAGSTGTYTIQTTASDGSVRDQYASVTTTTITANTLTSVTFETTSLLAGATSTGTLSFTTTNSLLNTDKIKLTFPTGFDLTAITANSAVCTPSIDGNLTTTVSGQILTITRTSGSTVTSGAKSCTISNVKNPTSAGSPGDFSVLTSTAADEVRDQNLAVTASTITPNTLAATRFEPFSSSAYSITNVRVNFTTVNSLLNTDKIKITFSSGFNLQNVTSSYVSCAPSIEGNTTASVSGQVLTITRTSGSTATAGAKYCIIGNVRNPTVAGTTGTATIQTTTASDAVRDQDTAVAGVTIVSSTGTSADSTSGGSVGGSPISSGGIVLSSDSTSFGLTFSTTPSDVQEVLTAVANVSPTGITERPELLQNPTVTNANVLIPRGTKIFTSTGAIYTGKIAPPLLIQQAALPRPLPKNLSYRYAYGFGVNQDIVFDKNVTLTFPFAPVGVTENVKMYMYNFAVGEYQMVDNGGTIAKDSRSLVVTTNTLGVFVAVATNVNVAQVSPPPLSVPSVSILAPSSVVPLTTPSLLPTVGPSGISGVVVPPAPSTVPASLVPLLSPSRSNSTPRSQVSTPSPLFADIAGNPAADAIVQLYKLGVVQGTTPTTFEPDASLTRGAVAKIAVLTYGYPVVDSAVPMKCSDVSPGSTFAKYIAAAEKAGVMGGYADGTCRLDKVVTVAEGLKILVTASRKLPAASVLAILPRSPFRDVPAWAADYVNFAYTNRLITGKTSTRLGASDPLTRGNMADMAIRLRNL